MEERTRNLWKLEWGNQLIDLENGYFLARFYKREDYFHVLEDGPWIIMGHYLTVTKWKPKFSPSIGTVHSTMVWVRFPELLVELFDEEILYAMGNAIGKTIKIDNTTLTARRGRYARICIEVKLDEPLIPFLTILGAQQRVEYEGLHMICFGCGKYGHREDGCPGSASSYQTAPPASQPVSPGGADHSFGLWMLPKYGSRRSTRQGGRSVPVQSRPTSSPHMGPTATDQPSMAQAPPTESANSVPSAASPVVAQSSGPPRPNKSQKPQASPTLVSSSRFAVLGALDQEGDIDQALFNLKAHIQAVPGPNQKTGSGPTHGKPKSTTKKDKSPAPLPPASTSVKDSTQASSGQSRPNRRAQLKDISNISKVGQPGKPASSISGNKSALSPEGSSTFDGDHHVMEVENPPPSM